MGFPLTDWQFWGVTACAMGAVWLLVKPFVGRGQAPPGPCSSCPKCKPAADAGKAGGRDGLVTLGKAR